MVEKKYMVLIFDGHGTGSDKGAVSGKFIEFDIVRKMCKATYDYLLSIPKENRNFLISYPERKKQLTISEQTNLMASYRKKGYKVVGIEEHMNSAIKTNGDGAEIWINKCTLSTKLANAILKEFKAIGQNSRGVKTGDLQFTNYGRDAALITEFGFVNSPTDRKIFDTDAEIKNAGIAIGKAIAKTLK